MLKNMLKSMKSDKVRRNVLYGISFKWQNHVKVAERKEEVDWQRINAKKQIFEPNSSQFSFFTTLDDVENQ